MNNLEITITIPIEADTWELDVVDTLRERLFELSQEGADWSAIKVSYSNGDDTFEFPAWPGTTLDG